MKEYYCYEILNKVNNKRYIGFSVRPKIRFKEHKQVSKQQHHLPLYKSMNKYGVENFEFNIIDKNKSKQKMLSLEIDYIKNYNTTNRNYGYNISSGGGGGNGVSRTEKTKKLLSDATKKLAQNPKWRENLSKKATEYNKNPKHIQNAAKYATKQSKDGKNIGIKICQEFHIKNPNAHYEFAMKQAKKCSYNGIIYESIAEASRKNNIPETSMRRKVTIL